LKAATHLAFAGLVGVVAKGLGADIGVVGGVALAAGALVPDIDTTTSGLGRWVKPISGVVERRLGHRTLTHSLLGLVVLSLMSSWLLLVSVEAWIWLLIGASSHLLIDAHNITGVPLLYPIRLEFVTVTNRALRVAYGSSAEFGYLAGFSLIALCLTPLSVDGFSPWFHRALGAPYGAVEDYLLWRNDYEVFADIDGVNLVTNESINKRFRVIDALGKDELLVEDEVGNTLSASLEGSDLQVRRIQAWRGEKIQVSTYRLDVSGRLISDLIYALPKGALRIHINADLVLNQALEQEPVLGSFDRLGIKGKRMLTRGASIQDLMPYSSIVIEAGTAIIRAEYSVGFNRGEGSEGEGEFEVLPLVPAVKTHVLLLPDLPSLTGLVIEVGDELIEGQLIARYVDDVALELSEAELEEARRQLSDLEAERLRAGEMYELRVKAIKQEIEDSTVRLEKLRYLVERNAEPRNSLLAVEKALEGAEQDLLIQETSWTSQQLKFEQDVRELRLLISKTEAQQNQDLEQQWVRAAVSGVVSDIKVSGISSKGIDLEVLILE